MMLTVGLANELGSARSLRGNSGVIRGRVLLVAAVAAAAFSSNVVAPSSGHESLYRLLAPSGYDVRTRLPLVLELHGSGGTAEGQAATSRFMVLAEREGFLVASLQAVAEGNRWNVPVTSERPDDVRYVS